MTSLEVLTTVGSGSKTIEDVQALMKRALPENAHHAPPTACRTTAGTAQFVQSLPNAGLGGDSAGYDTNKDGELNKAEFIKLVEG